MSYQYNRKRPTGTGRCILDPGTCLLLLAWLDDTVCMMTSFGGNPECHIDTFTFIR